MSKTTLEKTNIYISESHLNKEMPLPSSKTSLVKSKHRVRQHGEVFTPLHIVQAMLDMDGMREAVLDIRKTVLEPSVGEGVFLIEILSRRLEVELANASSLSDYVNNSLLSLTSLYGIELLEDNVLKCREHIYNCFYNYYLKALTNFNKKLSKAVLSSAETIIKANIVQGNFLTRKTPEGNIIVFSEWKEVAKKKGSKNIIVARTEYSLDEIYAKAGGEVLEKEDGAIFNGEEVEEVVDFTELLFADPNQDPSHNTSSRPQKYQEVKLVDVYLEKKI